MKSRYLANLIKLPVRLLQAMTLFKLYESTDEGLLQCCKIGRVLGIHLFKGNTSG